jgi:O-antigen/teichoic acid export membrane protein
MVPDQSESPNEQSFLEHLNKQFTGLSKDVLIYGIGGSLSQVITIITVPIITRILSVEEYGTLDVIYATVGYFAVLMGFRVGSGLSRYYYEVPESDLKNRQRMVSSVTWFVLLVSLPISFLISYFSPTISQQLFQSEDQTFAIRLAIFTLPVISIYNLMIGLQRIKRRPMIYLTINISHSLLYFILVVVLVWNVGAGIPGVFMAQFISYVAGALVGMWFARDLLALTFSKEWFFKMAAFGLPLLPASFLNWTLSSINRLALNSYSGVSQVGYYSLASKISQAMVLVVTSFTLAWEPFMMATLNKPESRKLYPFALNYYLIISMAIGAFLTVFALEIVQIMAPPSYFPSASLVGIFVLRQIIVGMNYITGAGIVWAKMTIYTSVALGVGVLANLAVNFLLTPRYGIFGASIADLVGFTVGAIVTYIVSNRLFPVQWNRRVMSLTFIGYWLLFAVSISIGLFDLGPGWQLLAKSILWILFMVFLWNLMDVSQREFLARFPKKIIQWISNRFRPGKN